MSIKNNIEPPRIDTKNMFEATYPKYMQKSLFGKIANFAYQILSVAIFPIYALRYLKHRIHLFLGYHFFVPSQSYSKKENIDFYNKDGTKTDENQKEYLKKGLNYLKYSFKAQFIEIKTADGVKLCGAFIPGKDDKGRYLSLNAPLIIHCLGQGGRFQDLGRYPDAIENIKKHNILVFNDRGVLKSEGRATKKGLFLDIESIYQYAIRKLKVPKSKITVWGHSFGTLKAIYLAAKHKKIKSIYDRSPAEIQKGVYYIAKEMFQEVFSYFVILPFVIIEKMASQRVVDKVVNFVTKHKIYINGQLKRPIVISKIIEVFSSIVAFVLKSKFGI